MANWSDPSYAGHQVAPGAPGVPAAADRAVGNMNHVANRSPHHPFRTGIGTTAGRHDAGDGLFVGLDRSTAGSLVVGTRWGERFFFAFSG